MGVLAAKAVAALKKCRMKHLVVAGGVGANRRLREKLDESVKKLGGRVFYPELELCTDNGAMIAFAAMLRIKAGLLPQSDGNHAFSVRPRWNLEMGGA